MKIVSNYVIPNFRINPQSFGQGQVTNPAEKQAAPVQTGEISGAKPALNVRVPIAYSHTDDIKLTDDLTAHCYKLANGQRVVIVPKDGPTIVKSYVNTGSLNEPDNLRGISHFIEHNLFNGSVDLGDKVFFDEVNKMGASTNASTSLDKTDYYIDSNLLEDTDFETQLALHAGMLQSPKFLLDKLEKEKKIVNSEINMCVSDNGNLGYTQTLKNLFNIKSSSKDLIAGTTDNITALTRDDVVKYYNDNYSPANTVTVITGEADVQKTMDLVSKYFNSNKTANTANRHFEKMVPVQKPVRSDIISPKTMSNESVLFIGFAGPENNNAKDKIYMSAVSYLTDGLFNSRFSPLEKKYGTSVNLSPERLSSNPDEKSAMMISAGVADDKSEMLLKDIYSVVNKLAQVPPSEEELTAVKNTLKKDNNKIFERSFALNNKIGMAFLNNNIEQLRDLNKIVDEMTAQDIMNAAKKYLDLNKAAVTVVHPSTTSPDTIKTNYNRAKSISFGSGISFCGANKNTPVDTTKVKTYKLGNNMEVVCTDVNSDNVEFRMGINENNWTPKKAAVADILGDILRNEDSLNMTVEQRNRFSDVNGIGSGIAAGQYGIGFSADFPVEKTKEAMAFFNDRIRNPKITDETVNAAKARLKDTYSGAEVSPYDKFRKVMYKGSPSAFSPKDYLDSLAGITTDDIRNFHREIFVKGEGIAAVTGGFSKYPQLKQDILNALGTYNTLQPKVLEPRKFYTPVEKTVVCTDVHKKNQANILEGFRFKFSKNVKDTDCVALLNEIFGGSPSSRLFSDLREKRHLAYAVSSSFGSEGDMGVFTLKIGTTTENQETGEKTFDNVQKSIEGFNDNIKKITTEKVTQAELDAAKKALKSAILSSLETNSNKTDTMFLSDKTYYGADYMNRRLADIDSITVDDIYNTARNIFNSKPVYSITATEETLNQNKEYLKSLEA